MIASHDDCQKFVDRKSCGFWNITFDLPRYLEKATGKLQETVPVKYMFLATFPATFLQGFPENAFRMNWGSFVAEHLACMPINTVIAVTAITIKAKNGQTKHRIIIGLPSCRNLPSYNYPLRVSFLLRGGLGIPLLTLMDWSLAEIKVGAFEEGPFGTEKSPEIRWGLTCFGL